MIMNVVKLEVESQTLIKCCTNFKENWCIMGHTYLLIWDFAMSQNQVLRLFHPMLAFEMDYREHATSGRSPPKKKKNASRVCAFQTEQPLDLGCQGVLSWLLIDAPSSSAWSSFLGTWEDPIQTKCIFCIFLNVMMSYFQSTVCCL